MEPRIDDDCTLSKQGTVTEQGSDEIILCHSRGR